MPNYLIIYTYIHYAFANILSQVSAPAFLDALCLINKTRRARLPFLIIVHCPVYALTSLVINLKPIKTGSLCSCSEVCTYNSDFLMPRISISHSLMLPSGCHVIGTRKH